MSAAEGIAARDRMRHVVEARVKDPALKRCCHFIFNNEDFPVWPAAAGHHHAYDGGLAVHTEEVLQGCIAMAEQYDAANMDRLITAALFHDISKTVEYERCEPSETAPAGWTGTDFKKKIYHIAGSYGVWIQVAKFYEVDDEAILEIGHCILAHHGRPEWGSPVTPQTLEAWILNYADGLSAYFGPGRGPKLGEREEKFKK